MNTNLPPLIPQHNNQIITLKYVITHYVVLTLRVKQIVRNIMLMKHL